MQFCKNLQKIGKEYSRRESQKDLLPRLVQAEKSFIFIGLYNMSVLLLQSSTQPTFIYVKGETDEEALTNFSDQMKTNFGVGISVESCFFFNECIFFNNPQSFSKYKIFFFHLNGDDFDLIRQKERKVLFKHIYDPHLSFEPEFAGVKGFLALIRQYVNNMSGIVTRKKSESAPIKVVEEKMVKSEEKEKKDIITNRLKEFEKQLDSILSKHNLKFE